MKIFTVQNLVFLIVCFVVFLGLSIWVFVVHKKFIASIKNMKADLYFKKNSKSYLINVADNRKRIYVSQPGAQLNIDPYRDSVLDVEGFDPNLTLKTYIPKEKTFGFKRFLRVMSIILFVLSLLTIILSSILMLSEFFHQDLVEILHMEYTRGFFDYFKEYDVVFGVFFLNCFSVISILTISDTIKTFRNYSPLYLRKFNQEELAFTYAPVIIEVR